MKNHVKKCCRGGGHSPLRCYCECNCDGYHTFDELYEHRHLLFLNLIYNKSNAWKSKHHADGSMYDGWFVAGYELQTGMITYHLPIKYWNMAIVPECGKAPEWDGHTNDDVLLRLKSNIC